MKRLMKTLPAVFTLLLLTNQSPAQSITSGDITGIITDSTGAVVPDATVILTNAGTNISQKVTTNAEGNYRFAFIAPGTYRVIASAAGFQTIERDHLVVIAGQPSAANFQLQVAGSTQTVQVSENASAVQTENADRINTYSTELIQSMPNPGGDLTYIVQTAPGVVMNTQAGRGNFSADGMPATSNLFSINGVNNNDPFLATNNSGASNLMLGSNDVAEASIVNNAYSAQYGQYAGSQVTYITKSGTNQFHGDAVYMWNGRALNSNQFFSNQVGQPTPFNNFNQWQTNLSGPIWKDHTFFDVNYEGLHSLLPTASALTLVPSPQFQAATLANLVARGNSAEIPFYQQMFAIYNDAPGVSSAVPVANNGGCQNVTALGPGVPCALQFRTTPQNLNTEYQWSARIDHVFSDKDRAAIRVLRDNGFQPSFTSPFGAQFNVQSNQPEMSAQISETHIFGPNTVNELKVSSLFLGAVFVPSDPAASLAALPTFVNFIGLPLSSVGAWGGGNGAFYVPQGRRFFQYQVLDDVSKVAGRHTFRMGFSWLHDSITDLNFQAIAGPIHGQIYTTLSNFFNGGGSFTFLNQAFPTSPEAGIRMNTLGGYVADDWKVSDRVTVSLNLRLENYANPACAASCFGRLSTTFTGAADPGAVTTPYNQMILSGQNNAYANTQPLVWEPRIGIAWRPFDNDGTVIRAGAGIFADELPGGLAEAAAFNTPGLNAFWVQGGTLAPGVPGSLFALTSAANQGLRSGFSSGGSFNSISQSVPGFVAPTLTSFSNTLSQPTYYKWNFEIEHSIGQKMLLSAGYNGMHGIYIPVADSSLNAYCPFSICLNQFAGLPTTPPNAALGTLTQYASAGTANYNGLTVSLLRRLTAGLSFNVNYTWSHALDVVSNGGVANNYFSQSTAYSIMSPQNPFDIKGNYGSADYDVRHYLNATVVFADAIRHAGFHWGPNRVFSGWTLSGNWFWRSGLPFSVYDSSAGGPLLGSNFGSGIFASPVTRIPSSCNSAIDRRCLTVSQFAPAADGFPTGFGTLGRNSIYGPHFFDVDLALMKEIAITERITFSVGAQAYNLLNHPNFDQPVNDIFNPQFGQSISTVGPATSLLGSLYGAGSSPRFIEIKGVLRF